MKVLVADDSALFRRVISDVLSCVPDVEVVGAVSTGAAAVQKVRELRPDLLTLDMEMPGMNGLEVLEAIRSEGVGTSTIVVSALTSHGGALTLQALSKGAFDFITKPEGGTFEDNHRVIAAELAPRVRALAQRLKVRRILAGAPPRSCCDTVRLPQAAPVGGLAAARFSQCAARRKPELVVVGVSTGGPEALRRILLNLSANLGVPVLVVQHMPPLFTRTLAEHLAAASKLEVREAVHGEVLRPDCVYIAPGGKHMRVVPGAARAKTVQITDDPPENNCRPAVDYLFRSVAHHFPGEALAVILTGMGSDGTLGLRLLKRNGCRVIAQDEATCVVFGMPKAAIEAGVVDAVLPIDDIAPNIVAFVRGALV